MDTAAIALAILEAQGCSIFDFLTTVLSSRNYSTAATVQKFNEDLGDLLEWLAVQERTSTKMTDWAELHCHQIYYAEIQKMSSISTGLHCNTSQVTPSYFKDFKIENLADKMLLSAPRFWNLLDTVLSADAELQSKKTRAIFC